MFQYTQLSIAIMVCLSSLLPNALSQCVSEMFTPAVVMPLAALQLPLTCSQVSYSWLPGYKLGLSSSLGWLLHYYLVVSTYLYLLIDLFFSMVWFYCFTPKCVLLIYMNTDDWWAAFKCWTKTWYCRTTVVAEKLITRVLVRFYYFMFSSISQAPPSLTKKSSQNKFPG